MWFCKKTSYSEGILSAPVAASHSRRSHCQDFCLESSDAADQDFPPQRQPQILVCCVFQRHAKGGNGAFQRNKSSQTSWRTVRAVTGVHALWIQLYSLRDSSSHVIPIVALILLQLVSSPRCMYPSCSAALQSSLWTWSRFFLWMMSPSPESWVLSRLSPWICISSKWSRQTYCSLFLFFFSF